MFDVDYDVFQLENLVSFPLYAASREVIKQYRPFLESLDLTYTQYIAMLVFWERKMINVKELGKLLYLDSGTLTPVLKSLEAKGLVHRYRSTEDERVLNVEITEAGQALEEQARMARKQMVEDTPLSLEEAKDLYRLLYKLLGVEV